MSSKEQSYTLMGRNYLYLNGRWIDAETRIGIPKTIERELTLRFGKPKPKKKRSSKPSNKISQEPNTRKNKHRRPKRKSRTAATRSKTYISECWNCHTTIDSETDVRCPACKMFKCSKCGRCMCGYSSRR